MRDHDGLQTLLRSCERGDEKADYGLVVEVFFGLIKDYRVTPLPTSR